MYREILIHPNDRKYQKILWSEDPLQSSSVFQLNTVTYGLSCAAYLAIRTLLQLAADEDQQWPLGADVVRKNVYVDDVFSGADTLEEAQEVVRQVDRLLLSGGFHLQKWTSNCDKVLIPVNETRQLNLPKVLDDTAVLRALGISWDPQNDNLVFAFQKDIANIDCPTKHSVLSFIARLFDPLELMAPVIVTAKILQNLWKVPLEWDAPIPSHLTDEWTSFVNVFKTSTRVLIPRWIGTKRSSKIEVHGFSDASQLALSAAVYLRVAGEDCQSTSSLIIAKTKVAPLKPTTIPRLELSAAVLLVQLISRTLKILNVPQPPVHLWVDSQIALTWITGDPTLWKDFVENRVAYIRKTAPAAIWHHVPGTDNPADIASRGSTFHSLVDCDLWWTGPKWLLNRIEWPSSLPEVPDTVNLEERPKITHVVTTGTPMWNLVDRYSSLDLLLRVTARLFEASRLFRRPADRVESSLILTPQQLDAALLFWVRTTQRAYFSSALNVIEKGESLPRSNGLSKLTPMIDSNGLLRVGGRLCAASIDADAKHPLILPRRSALSTLSIDQIHRRTLHGGTQLTLGTLRQRFWIVGGRAPVRSFIRKCVVCTRQRGTTPSQQMGQLPRSHTSPSRPFLHSGVAYAGPFTLKTWKGRAAKTYKAYLIIFVCFSTPAVHLELATDYTTDGFIAAYRRFASRRGICSTLTSDNGTNFVGADAELKRLFSHTSKQFAELRSLLANDRTEWHFNPPVAPHFGGKWEAAVKSTKFHFRRVLGETLLTYEEFSSLLIQIEGVLNSRPLCPLSDDPDDFSVLTPGHFLTGSALNTLLVS